MTNGDKLRTMTDEEFAELFDKADYCPYMAGTESECKYTDNAIYMCSKCTNDWLRSETE